MLQISSLAPFSASTLTVEVTVDPFLAEPTAFALEIAVDVPGACLASYTRDEAFRLNYDNLGGVSATDDFESGNLSGWSHASWDIVTGQRAIAVHAKENMGATDEGVAMWRKICRDALRGKTPGVWPSPANGGDVHHKAYTHDTIFILPVLADAKADSDMQLSVSRRVTEIVLDDSLPAGKERRREIKKRLKALEKDCRRQYA